MTERMHGSARGREVLAATDVVVRFGGVAALDRVSLSFRGGEVCGVIGPNGAGKTTLFDVLSGVRRPTAGRILLDGVDVTRTSCSHLALAGVRRTFQRQQVFGWLSVRDNVVVALESEGRGGSVVGDMLGFARRGSKREVRRARVDEALELCGLTSVADVTAATLDIGRARLVELARAVVARPSVLLLDEPTSGLADREAAHLGAVIEALRHEHDCAVAVVEHDIEFISTHCQRIVVLDLGRVIADGRPDEVRSRADVQEAYLGASVP